MEHADKRSQELMDRYGKSEKGNFWIENTIGVPHPFCIVPGHIEVAQDFGGILREAAIEAAEQRGVRCGMKGCRLSFAEHEQALLVSCKEDLQDKNGKNNKELCAYLLEIKDKAEADKYAGFAFVEAK